MSMPPPSSPGSYPQGPTAAGGPGPAASYPGQPPGQGPTAQPGWSGPPPGPQPWPRQPGPGQPGPGHAGGFPGQFPGQPAAAPSSDKVAKVAQVLAPILVLAGLSIPQYGSVGWVDYTLWAIFAAVASLAQLVTLAANRDPAQLHLIRMIATGSLVAYWVVIVLPGISSNSGFLQTLGVGCAAVAAWLGGARR